MDNIDVVDLDEDGEYEVICANTTAGTINYCNKLSSGQYEIITIDDIVANPGFVKASDLDLDGDLDLLAADKGYSGPYLWYENVGNTTFERRAIDENVQSSNRIYLVDFDNDLDQDFVGWSNFPRQLNWWENIFCQPSMDTVEIFLCDGQPEIYNGIEYDMDGIFLQSDIAQNGCDSSQIVKVISIFSTGELEYTIENNLIMLQNVGASTTVNWIDCATLDTIAIEQGPNYMPPYDGSFTALITEGVCDVGVSCIDYMFVSSLNTVDHEEVQILPNPSQGIVNIKGSAIEQVSNVSIYNSSGALVSNQRLQEGQIDLSDIDAGLYFLIFQINGIGEVHKLVLN